MVNLPQRKKEGGDWIPKTDFPQKWVLAGMRSDQVLPDSLGRMRNNLKRKWALKRAKQKPRSGITVHLRQKGPF